MDKPFLYCAKNVISQYEGGVEYCTGPNGKGIEAECTKTCSSACSTIESLITNIGTVLVKRVGIRKDEIWRKK